MIDERYAAGFFDGEGCIHIARNVRVILSGCFVPGLLERFVERWGGKVSSAVWSKNTCRPGVRWEITGPKAARFLDDVFPHLIEKRKQAELAREYLAYKQSLNVRGGKGYSGEQRIRILDLEIQVRKEKHIEHHYS